MNRIAGKYRFLMKSHNRTLLLLDVTFKVIFCVFLLPLLSLCLDYVMHLWGQSYITAQNVLSFLTFPPTIILLLLLLLIIALMIYIEIITIVFCCGSDGTGQKANPLRLIGIGFRKSLHCMRFGNIALPFYTVLLFILTSLTILIGITVYARIDLPGGASDAAFIKGLIILSLIFISFIAFRGLFVVYFCMNERLKLTYAFEQSKLLLKGRSLRTAATLLLYNLLLTISFFLLYYTVLFIAALLVYAFADKSMVITVFLSAYPTINFYLFIFFGMVAFTTNMNVISSMFATYREEYFADILLEDARFNDGLLPEKVKSRNPIITGILIFMLTAAIFNFYLTIRNDTFYLRDALSGIMITSHRGNSHVAPENTLPALENAIIAHSDYAEIDIQQTKDGEIVLLHDQSLWRTTGQNRYIWELTYDEVKELDAGSWYGEEFKNTKIPTLAEVFKLCKGRIKLNIEVKTNVHSKNMEEKLVALIEQYDFERQCVVSSWNYDTLVDIKERNSDIKTGYIMSVTYGNFYDREFIDFFSIRSGFISKYVVDSAHKAGKEVHAWTVNSVNEIERMKSVGVDCIITDNPSLAMEVVYQNDTNKTLIELLNKMLYRRSFYKIVQSNED